MILLRRQNSPTLLVMLVLALLRPCHAAGPATASTAPQPSLFRDPTDGAFDISAFLSTRTGFLPLVVPITEPAVGFGLAGAVAFFHEKPSVRPGPAGAPARVNLPSTSLVLGAATENGTWLAGLGHLGIWNQGRIRYLGAAGYGAVNLDWYGRNDAFNGRSVSYTNDVFAFVQRITFQLGDSDFYLGPQYRFIATNSEFGFSNFDLEIAPNEFQSKTSGAGVSFGYDTRDHPFSPTRGVNANLSYLQSATWLGGDFDYYRIAGYSLFYAPLAPDWVLGTNLGATLSEGDVPFYDLPFILMRGVPAVRYVGNAVAQAEVELRYDLTRRWSLIGFGGVGWTADSMGNLFDGNAQVAGGAGFRYLVAREYGLRLGVDVAYGDEGLAMYITVGTGWVRP
jgi:hypothetical protein